ncbi:hypothetical protein [Arthrobacter castelli]|uniref:hypothetical protein n=1 Tax=Arthrobacter castelli TaxID=271431 RepID=UPI000417D95E|nr:hypothetical protein [Arthrobacter castelli]
MAHSWAELERRIREEEHAGRGKKTTYELPPTLRREMDIERAQSGQSAKAFATDALVAWLRHRRTE